MSGSRRASHLFRLPLPAWGWLAAWLLAMPCSAVAADTTIAVAANFVQPMRALIGAFEAAHPHRVRVASGSSGKLFAQIQRGAPFDAFLSADQAKPAALVAAGLAARETVFTYALGQLVLWAPKPGHAHQLRQRLIAGGYSTLALANPRHAPYGVAATQVLAKLQVAQPQRGDPARWVYGENIAQTFQFAATGHAQMAFVAASQITSGGLLQRGSAWLVPATLHEPIRQDAVGLPRGANNQATQALLRFLREPIAHALLKDFGYRLPSPNAGPSF